MAFKQTLAKPFALTIATCSNFRLRDLKRTINQLSGDLSASQRDY